MFYAFKSEENREKILSVFFTITTCTQRQALFYWELETAVMCLLLEMLVLDSVFGRCVCVFVLDEVCVSKIFILRWAAKHFSALPLPPPTSLSLYPFINNAPGALLISIQDSTNVMKCKLMDELISINRSGV